MKSQLSLEYYASIILFILFVSYIFFQTIALVPRFIKESDDERLKSEAYQISELLVNDVGEPSNWNIQPQQAKRLGLSTSLNKTNLLNISKISVFNSSCNTNYLKVRELIGTEYYFLIRLIELDSNAILIDCPSIDIFKQLPVTKSKTSITRIVALDSNKIGKLEIQLW